MKMPNILLTAAAATALTAGAVAAQDIVYMTDAEGVVYEVTMVEVDPADVPADGFPTEQAEALGADESFAGTEADEERLVLTEYVNDEYNTAPDSGGAEAELRTVDTFEDEQAEDEMIDEDAAR